MSSKDPAAALAREMAKDLHEHIIPRTVQQHWTEEVLTEALAPLFEERERLVALVRDVHLSPTHYGDGERIEGDPYLYTAVATEPEWIALRDALLSPAAGAEEGGSDAEDKERLRWAWETASDPDHPDREQAIICLESYVGRANGWFGGDRDEDDQ